MPSELIFITGATGFIGAATAIAALKADYRLRISVRKEAQIEKLKTVFADHADQIEFVVVPDITVKGAFSKVLDGVHYVLHLASPLAKSTNKSDIFPPAVDGTVSILRDATKAPSIKKVVITSSVLALIPIKGVPEGQVIEENTNWDLSVDPEGNFESENDLATAIKIYSASKLLANQATWQFVEQEKPHFAVVTIHPSLVYGHNLLQQSAQEVEGGTNGVLFSSIMNGALSDNPLMSVYVGDVADAHIKALDSSIKSGSKYLVSGRQYTWKDVLDILQKHYPGVPYKLTADGTPELAKLNTSKAEKELGIKWAATETIITEVMNQQLGFSGLTSKLV